MKWVWSSLVGALGSLAMFLAMIFAIHGGVAPFNTLPSAAFLEQLGMNIEPLALITHFFYGIVWSLVLMSSFSDSTSATEGMVLAFFLWLLMMVVYSPIIGWGIFGFGEAHKLPDRHPLFLEQGPMYAFLTLVLHLIYGFIIGFGNGLITRK